MLDYERLRQEIDDAKYLPDTPVIYIDEKDYRSGDEKKDVDDIAIKVAEARAEFSRIKSQYESIQWCKRQAASLSVPVHILIYWDYDDQDSIADAMFEIMFATWNERQEFWSHQAQSWIKFRSPFGYEKVCLITIAGFRTLKLLIRHPHPVVVLRGLKQAIRQQEWLIWSLRFKTEEPHHGSGLIGP